MNTSHSSASHSSASASPRQRPTFSVLLTLAASLREGTAAARAAGNRIAIRGQLGPSVGQRHDRFPERFL